MSDQDMMHYHNEISASPREGDAVSRHEDLARLMNSLIGLPDAEMAASAACALVAAALADAGLVLARRAVADTRQGDGILADYPSGIGLADIGGAETVSVSLPRSNDRTAGQADTYIMAWRSFGDRQFNAEDRTLLANIAPCFAPFVERLLAGSDSVVTNSLDPETGLWSLPRFVEQADRRFDRLDIEGRIGTMFAFGWVRSDGAAAPEASPVVVKGSVACLQEMLRPADLIGRIGPTRLAAWCDGVDHFIAAERGDRIVARLETLLAGSGRHAAIGVASRWPLSGDDPATMLGRARAGLEQARLKAAAQARAAVRIFQPPG
jgi:hypothetical protein